MKHLHTFFEYLSNLLVDSQLITSNYQIYWLKYKNWNIQYIYSYNLQSKMQQLILSINY